MTQIRRYRLDDIDVMLGHIETHLRGSRLQKIRFAPNKIRDLLTGNLRNSQFFCNVGVDGDDRVVAGLCASVRAYIFSYDVHAFDHFIYIQPGHRSIGLATALVAGYVDWAKERQVKEVLLQNFAGEEAASFSKLAERLGFKAIGTFHSMEL